MKWASVDDFGLAILLGPPSKEEAESPLRTGFHTLLSPSVLALQKEKSLKRASVRVSIEGKKKSELLP